MPRLPRRPFRPGRRPGRGRGPDALHPARLDLVPGSAQHLSAELDGPPALAAALGVRVPADWPPELYEREAVEFSLVQVTHTPAEDACWLFYYLVLRADQDGRPTAIGVGGFKGPPEDGEGEVGYSVMPAYRRRGLASEAVEGFLARAFADDRVRRVAAETFPELIASVGVLHRCGFRYLGEGSEDGTIRFGIERGTWNEARAARAEEGSA